MEDILWKIGYLILAGVGYIVIVLFANTNYFLYLLRWLWIVLFGIGGFVSLGFMIGTIDFHKPIFLSVYWSTFGYLVLAIVLWLLAIRLFLTEFKYYV